MFLDDTSAAQAREKARACVINNNNDTADGKTLVGQGLALAVQKATSKFVDKSQFYKTTPEAVKAFFYRLFAPSIMDSQVIKKTSPTSPKLDEHAIETV